MDNTTVAIEILQKELAKAETDILKWKTLFFKAEAEKNMLDEKLYSEKEKTMKLKNDLAIEKEEVEKFKDEIRVMSESQLQCSVCSEVIVGATIINCGHTFCEFCLREWQKKKSNCPLCRTDIKHKVAVRILDEFTDKLYQQLANEDGLEARASLKLRREAEREARTMDQQLRQRAEEAENVEVFAVDDRGRRIFLSPSTRARNNRMEEEAHRLRLADLVEDQINYYPS